MNIITLGYKSKYRNQMARAKKLRRLLDFLLLAMCLVVAYNTFQYTTHMANLESLTGETQAELADLQSELADLSEAVYSAED